MRSLWLLGLVACSSPNQPVLVRPVAPDPTITYVLPTAAPPVAWHLACEGDRATPPAKRITYDLAQVQLYPVHHGPRMTDRPRTGKARTWLQLDEAIQRAQPMLARCWKWASARGAPETTIELAFTMTPFGKTTAHAVSATSGKSEELVGCLQETLQHLAIADLSPRTTRMHARIAFVRAAQPKWPTLPKRPTATPVPPRSRTCTPVLDGAPPDQLASPVEYTIDDFDDTRIPRQPGAVPTVSIGCHRGGHVHTSKESVRLAIESNLGALQACYAAAHARDAALVGKQLELIVDLADVTTPTKVTVLGTTDPIFHACLTAAANELWLAESVPEATIEAHFHFELAAPSAAPGDPDVALAQHARSLSASQDDRVRCEHHAQILELLARQAPWLDDRRVLVATRELTALAARLPAADAIACIKPVEKRLRQIAYGDRRAEKYLRWSWIDRIEAVLPIAAHLEWREQLAWMHAASLALSATRHVEGMAKLREIAATGTNELVRGLAEEQLAHFELPKHVAARHCDGLR